MEALVFESLQGHQMVASECHSPSSNKLVETLESASPETANSDVLDLAFQAGLLQDNRKSPRRRIRVSVPAIPVDDTGRSVGPPFVAATRNLSASGICLIHTQPVTAKYLLVELPGTSFDQQHVAVEVIRCCPVDDVYEIAGPFVTLTGGNESAAGPNGNPNSAR